MRGRCIIYLYLKEGHAELAGVRAQGPDAWFQDPSYFRQAVPQDLAVESA